VDVIYYGIGAEPAGAFDNAKHAARHSFAVLFSAHDIPGLSAFCLQTRLTEESRLRRGNLAKLDSKNPPGRNTDREALCHRQSASRL